MKETVSTNPIIRSLYTADPAPMVWGDTLYLYTTHDENELKHDFYTMVDWRCFSTKDMELYPSGTGSQTNMVPSESGTCHPALRRPPQRASLLF